MELSCSKHRQSCQRRDSHHRPRKSSNCKRNADSPSRNYNPGSHQRQSRHYQKSRNRKSDNRHHSHSCNHRQYYDNVYRYGRDTSGGESSNYTSSSWSDSSSNERLPRYDVGGGHCRMSHSRRSSPRRTGHSSKRSSYDSDFAPMNYDTPGCVGCQKRKQWAQGYAPPMGGVQAPPPPQGGWKTVPAQPISQLAPGGQVQPQQQPQGKPPPPELEELRKNVFKGIKEFTKSLKSQQWLGDMNYLKSSRNVKHGHKEDTLEDHRKGSRRREWVPIY